MDILYACGTAQFFMKQNLSLSLGVTHALCLCAYNMRMMSDKRDAMEKHLVMSLSVHFDACNHVSCAVLHVFVESCTHPGSISNSGGVLINKADHDDLSKMAKANVIVMCFRGYEWQRITKAKC